MGDAALTWYGLEEFKADLRRLPVELRDEGRALVLRHATAARDLTIANYPEGPTGALKRGVVMTEERSEFGMMAVVKSRAYHAHLYEYGSRHQPPAPPEKRLGTHAARERRKMYEALKRLMESKGLKVTGDAW